MKNCSVGVLAKVRCGGRGCWRLPSHRAHVGGGEVVLLCRFADSEQHETERLAKVARGS